MWVEATVVNDHWRAAVSLQERHRLRCLVRQTVQVERERVVCEQSVAALERRVGEVVPVREAQRCVRGAVVEQLADAAHTPHGAVLCQHCTYDGLALVQADARYDAVRVACVLASPPCAHERAHLACLLDFAATRPTHGIPL